MSSLYGTADGKLVSSSHFLYCVSIMPLLRAVVNRNRGKLRSAECAAPAAGAKRKGHLRFPFLFELLPFPNITREQLAAMLYRYAGEPDGAADLSAYTDAVSISPYAEKAVEWCVAKGILSGKSATRLAPQDTATRAECAAMLQRFAAL